MSKIYYISENINEGSFEEWDTIVDASFEMNYDAESMEKDGIPFVSDGHLARGFPLEQPMMVVAATGSGKTRRLIIPYSISCILSGCSLLINDPKGELYKHTKKLLKKMGYKIIIVDLRDLDYGERFNCCEYPARLHKQGNTKRADEMFQAMFDTFLNSVRSEKDPFWHTTGAAYLTGLAELCCDLLPAEKVTINTIYELHIQGNKTFNGSSLLKTYMEMHEDKPYYKLIAPYINAPNETRGSLDSVLTSAISKFCRNSSVVDQTTNSTFDIAELIEEKTALFIISRDESTVYNALITTMVNEIYEVVIDMAEERYNGRLPRHLSIILDEFGNLAPIDDINAKITVSRSRNVGWCLCCQSLDQLTLKYTADVAKIILGNCNIAYMYSSDINLLKMLSDLCGRTTDEYTHESKPLLSVEQLRHFNKKDGQTLFLLERMRPFIGFLPDISEYSIIPEEKTGFIKRKPQVIEKVDFDAIVREEKRKRSLEGTNHSETDPLMDRWRFGMPMIEELRIPFGENNANADRSAQGQHRATTPKPRRSSSKHVEIPPKNETKLRDGTVTGAFGEEEKGSYVRRMIEIIDRRIAELEEEERKEREEREKQEKIKAKKNNTSSSVVIKKIMFFEETASVIGEFMGVSYEMGEKILQQTLSKRIHKIRGIPREKAEKMIERLKQVGTVAIVVDDEV